MSCLPKGCCDHGIPLSASGGTHTSVLAMRATADHACTRSTRLYCTATEAFTAHSSLMSEPERLEKKKKKEMASPG